MKHISFACVVVGLLSCAGGQRVGDGATAEPGGACPTLETDVPEALCEDLPEDFGLSRLHPVEWGRQAATGIRSEQGLMPNSSLYFGRLICADGSRPAIYSRVTDGKSPLPSSSPRNPELRGFEESEDILDFWRLRCGDRIIGMYSNVYRCGGGCVPSPFRVVPASAWSAYVRGKELQSEGDHAGALASYEEAVAAFPTSVDLQVALVTATLEEGQLQRGLERADAALEQLPHAPFLGVLRTIALVRLGRLEAAEGNLREVRLRLPPDDPTQGMVLCAQAFIHEAAGDLRQADHLRALTCKWDGPSCCPDET